MISQQHAGVASQVADRITVLRPAARYAIMLDTAETSLQEIVGIMTVPSGFCRHGRGRGRPAVILEADDGAAEVLNAGLTGGSASASRSSSATISA